VRHGLAETREGLPEGEWIIAAAETVINPVLGERRFNSVTAKKPWPISSSKVQLFLAS
jgi:hypothetical protein